MAKKPISTGSQRALPVEICEQNPFLTHLHLMNQNEPVYLWCILAARFVPRIEVEVDDSRARGLPMDNYGRSHPSFKPSKHNKMHVLSVNTKKQKKRACVCTCVHACAQVCNMHAHVCISVHKCAHMCISVHMCAQVCIGVHKCGGYAGLTSAYCCIQI